MRYRIAPRWRIPEPGEMPDDRNPTGPPEPAKDRGNAGVWNVQTAGESIAAALRQKRRCARRIRRLHNSTLRAVDPLSRSPWTGSQATLLPRPPGLGPQRVLPTTTAGFEPARYGIFSGETLFRPPAIQPGATKLADARLLHTAARLRTNARHPPRPTQGYRVQRFRFPLSDNATPFR